jgi:hypothetical protein
MQVIKNRTAKNYTFMDQSQPKHQISDNKLSIREYHMIMDNERLHNKHKQTKGTKLGMHSYIKTDC